MWCALAGVAGTLNRNIWLPRISADGVERFRTYPGKLITVLVAGPGITRKSTAVGIIQSLMKEANSTRMFVGKITPEQLLAKLASFEDKRAVLTIIADELSVLLSKQQYAEPMINLLLKLSNALDDDEYETRTVKHRLLNACVTILAATTPSSLGLSIPPEAHQHGFQRRVCYVYAEQSGKVESLTTDPNDVADAIKLENSRLKATLVQGLRDMSRLKGPIFWSRATRQWYDDWYRAYKRSNDSIGEGWPSSRPEHLVELGICIAISNEFKMELDIGSLQAADLMLSEHVERHFHKTFAYVGRHANAEQLRHIVALFKKPGDIISSNEIYHKTMIYFPSGRDLQLALEALKQAGVLRMLVQGQNEQWEYLKEMY
jgi:hypothetical protein